MAPGCAFEGWGEACKKKYNAMKAEVEQLKSLQAELAELKTLQDPALLQDVLPSGSNTLNLTLLLSLTGIYVASPLCSFNFRI